MKPQKTVKTETLRIAAGTAVLCAVMLLVYLLLGQLRWQVVASAVFSGCWAVLNFFLMGLTVQKAAVDTARAKNLMQFSYSLRMLGSALVMIVGFTVPAFEPIAVVVPLLFPRITILGMQISGKYKPEPKTESEGGEQ